MLYFPWAALCDDISPDLVDVLQVERRIDGRHPKALAGEKGGELVGGLGYRRIDRSGADAGEVADAKVPGERPRGRECGLRTWVAGIVASHRRERGAEVGEAARERTNHLEIGEYLTKSADPGDLPDRRFQAKQAAMGGGPTHRAAAVGPDRERPETGRNGRGPAAGRAARGSPGSERVERGTEQGIRGVALNGEFRNVGLAYDDSAGGTQPRDRRLILVWLEAFIRGAAPGGGQAGREDVVFDCDRHAVERRQLRTLTPAQGRSPRRLARCHPVFSDDRVDPGVELVDARMDCVESLRGREPAIRVTLGQSRCAKV